MIGKILRGPQVTKGYVEKGLGEYFFEAAEEYGERIFQIDPNREKSETYNQVKLRSVRVALYLQKIGIKPGDVIMPICQNDIDNIVPVLAAVFLGATVSSLDLALDLYDIKYCIDLVRPRIIFVVKEGIELVEKALREMELDTKIVAVGGNSTKYPNMYDVEKESTEGEESFKPYESNPKKDVAFIMFSSGTTNLPKGVMWSHSAVLQGAVRAKGWVKKFPWAMNPSVHSCTLYWNTALWITANCMMNGTPKVTIGTNPTAEKYLEVVQHYQVSYAFFSAPMLNKIITLPDEIFQKYDTSCLKHIHIGGSPFDSKTILKVRKLFPSAVVLNVYGSTETGSTSFRWPFERDIKKDYISKPNSCGKLTFNSEAKVIDVITGEILGPNQEGEILIKSPNQMLGFYNKPTPPEIFDADGFLKTGDLGYYDEDEYFYIVDRINEIYKFRTYRICPQITENLLMKHPAIKEAIVIGLPHNADQYHGAGCLVLNKGCELSVEEIDKYITNNLGDSYRLRGGVKFVHEVPRTPSEKYKRRAIRDLFLGNR